MKYKLGIILPTNNPSQFLNMLLPTVTHMVELIGDAVWLINFQPPWIQRDIRFATSILGNHGFDVKFTYTSRWDKPIKIIKMREMCAKLEPDCQFYLFIDDDFKLSPGTKMFHYTSGQRYSQSLDYLERQPGCGLINTKSFLGGHRWGLKIGPCPNHMADMYATNRGLFLRNMSEHGFLLSPDSMHDLRGDLEESALAFARIELGYYAAKAMNNPTVHLTGKLDQYDNDLLNMHNFKVINENVGKWIRNRYNAPEWQYEDKRLPGNLWDKYLNAGGADIDSIDSLGYTIAY